MPMTVSLTRRAALVPVAAGVAALVGAPAAMAVEEAPSATTRLVVTSRAGAAVRGADLARAAKGELLRSTPGIRMHVVAVPSSAAARARRALASAPGVEVVEPDGTVLPAATPDDPYFPSGYGSHLGGQWGFAKASLPAAWDTTTGAAGVTIAIVDSGIAPHPDLVGKLLPGRNVLDGSTSTNDTSGHGTSVAGSAAASTNDGAGIAGACWSCSLLPVKVYEGGAANASDVASGITWAADQGARVINVSMAGTSGTTALANAVAYAQARGALVVAAAGNGGCDCPTYPAAYPDVLAVAATTQADGLYGSSNRGAWVDLAAPSGQVTTQLQSSTGAWQHGTVGGTSLAAPVVAGAAGLLLSAQPSASAGSVAAALTGSADVLGGVTVAHGRLNAGRAVAGFAWEPTPAPTSTAPPVITGTAAVGSDLTASSGSWSGTVTSTSHQWRRCGSTGCAPVAGATGRTYAVTADDAGSSIEVAVTAANEGGASTATSARTATVAAPFATATQAFSSSLSPKQATRTFSMAAAAGAVHAELRFGGGCSSLSLALTAADGSRVASASGPSVLVLDGHVPVGGPLTATVTGACKASFTLSITAAR